MGQLQNCFGVQGEKARPPRRRVPRRRAGPPLPSKTPRLISFTSLSDFISYYLFLGEKPLLSPLVSPLPVDHRLTLVHPDPRRARCWISWLECHYIQSCQFWQHHHSILVYSSSICRPWRRPISSCELNVLFCLYDD